MSQSGKFEFWAACRRSADFESSEAPPQGDSFDIGFFSNTSSLCRWSVGISRGFVDLRCGRSLACSRCSVPLSERLHTQSLPLVSEEDGSEEVVVLNV